MGIKLVSPGALAPWYTKVIPPVSRGLEGWFCFDTAIERVGFNRALGKSNAKVIGAPVVFSTHARFKGGSNYLETAIAETPISQLLSLARRPVHLVVPEPLRLCLMLVTTEVRLMGYRAA